MTSVTRLGLGRVRLPEFHPRADDVHCLVFSHVIEHGDGLIVVDTGPRAGHPVIDELYSPDVISIVDALNQASFDERDVTAIVNTHLHFDHCGQNDLLGAAEVWVTAAEVEAAGEELYTVPEWAAIAPERLRLSTDREWLAPGVQLLHTPGHTPGHQSIAVETDHGLELVVGQACYTCADFIGDGPAVTDMHDPSWHQVGIESITRLRALAPMRAHFSHDATIYRPA